MMIFKTLGDESPSKSMVKKWAAEFREGRVWRMMNSLGVLKRLLQMKMLR